MCPLSAFSQLFVLFFMLLTCCTALAQSLAIYFGNNKNATITMGDYSKIDYNVTGNFEPGEMYCLEANSHDPDIAKVSRKIFINPYNSTGSFDIYGNFLGTTNITVELKSKNCSTKVESESFKMKVVRKNRPIDKIFTISVAILVGIIYINFGAALKIEDLKGHLKRPIGPVIGLIGQFIFMPLLSYTIGYVLFPRSPAMQLGIFFTGCSPGGGGSNIWTALLDGNIDLSIAMTTISTFMAFAMIPFWTFTLGALIFDRNNLEIPYRNISTYAVGLVVPLVIGYLIQKYSPKAAEFLRKSLKGFSAFLIIFIIIFAIVTNLYLFQLFSWRIIVSGMCLPWIGYMVGWLISKVLNQPPKDCLTIAIEIGLHNTGIAIFLLRFSLPQPEADLTTIAPVAVAIFTPVPLFILFLTKLLQRRMRTIDEKKKYALTIDIASDGEMDLKPTLKKNGVVSIS